MKTEIPSSFFARLGAAARYAVSGTAPESWFGPQKPLEPQAPPEVKGRQWDYPFGANLSYTPRSEAALSFRELRSLADALPLLRLVIETRKDQIAGLSFTVRSRDPRANSAAAPRIAKTLAFLARPDRRHDFATWLRLWLEDMLVLDAATLYPRLTRGGDLYAVDVIDGSTITPLIAEDGRTPEPPDPAYQQVLHGVPAADFLADELLYLPRNPRPHRLYGMSPVEQVALTINIALRRDMATLDYYQLGSTPDAFATLPKDWTLDQIRQFQDYFDALMSGNSARRRMVKFMPTGFELRETRQPPLKDQYDEWLARVICYAFSIPPSPFVNQVNRATSETLRMQSAQEGLVPLKAWVKGVLDEIVQVCLKLPDLEFAWVGDDAVDPLQQAQTLSLLVGAGIKTREEARAELGLAPGPAVAPRTPVGGGAKAEKFNPYHDPKNGQFTTPEGAGSAGAKPAPVEHPRGEDITVGEAPAPVAPPPAPPLPQVTPPPVTEPPALVLPMSPAVEAAGWLARFGPAIAAAIQALAADVVAPSIVLGALFVPSSDGVVDEGPVPGRADMTYRWAHDEADVTFKVLIDGQWRTLLVGTQKDTNVYRDSSGDIIARAVPGVGGRLTLIADVAALDSAAANMRAGPADGGDAAESNTGAGSGLNQIYYDPATGRTLVVPAGTDPAAVPPGFVPLGSQSDGTARAAPNIASFINSDGSLINADRAIIDPGKLTNYALAPGNPKAALFKSILGYDDSNVSSLIDQIRDGVKNSAATPGLSNEFGSRFRVDILITGPNGNTANVRTAFIYDRGSILPRLVTLYVKQVD